jgi:hypothetical protein
MSPQGELSPDEQIIPIGKLAQQFFDLVIACAHDKFAGGDENHFRAIDGIDNLHCTPTKKPF